MKRKHQLLIIGLFVAANAILLTSSQEVMAGEGIVTPDGITAACGSVSLVCSSYGASWRWYPTNSNSVNTDGSRRYINSDGENPGYVKDTNITGCASIGGYWRYSLIVKQTGKGYGTSGDSWTKGEQIGTMGISGPGDPGFRSYYLYSSADQQACLAKKKDCTLYQQGWNGKTINGQTIVEGTWNQVQELYNDAKAHDPGTYKEGWGYNSNLAWFCYAGKSFKAKATVGDQTTNYVVGSDANGNNEIGKSITTKAISCNSNSGCDVTFRFDLKKLFSANSNYNSTVYHIEKGSSASGPWSRVSGYTSDRSSSPATGGTNVFSTTDKVKAGNTLCYRIGYKPHGSFTSSTYRYVRACAYGTGTLGSSISIKTKRDSSSDYANHTEDAPLYVKPGDKVDIRGTFTPTYQVLASKSVSAVTVGLNTRTANATIQNSFNNLVEPDWNNAFSVKMENQHGIFNEVAKNGTVGSGSAHDSDRDYAVSSLDVGETLVATAHTNGLNTTKTTPKNVKIDFASNSYKATVNNDAVSASNYIKVPYSFKNSVEFIDNDDSEKIVYAGEQVSLKDIVAKVSPHEYKNSPLGKYATIVPNATIQICGANDECVEKGIGTLNPSGLLDGIETQVSDLGITLNVPDVSAGNKFCVTAKIKPATSGEESPNMDGEGDKLWSEEKSMCYTVAKRPTLQVWGGNVYSNGNIKTSIADKRRLKDPEGNEVSGGHYIFGSWAELGVIANRSVTGFASGAGYGYNNDYVTLSNHSGGFNFCNVSTLSFANDKCSEETGSLGATLPLANDKESIKNRLEDLKKSGVSVIVPNKGEENVYIKENIINMDPANTLDDLPKTVVYAENDIYIRCGEEEDSTVTRIDAVLIAENNVVTCADQDGKEPDINSRRRSHRLVINGAVIAGKLIANRTYGAATGNDSMVPAEIINFDPTLYLWGNIGTSDDNTTNINMTTNYIRELPPRY